MRLLDVGTGTGGNVGAGTPVLKAGAVEDPP